MRAWLEKIRRKSHQSLSGNRGPFTSITRKEIATTSDRSYRFEKHFYPYHFIRPDEIRRDFRFDGDIPLRWHRDPPQMVNLLYPAYWGLIHANLTHDVNHQSAGMIAREMSEYLLHHGRPEQQSLLFEYHSVHPRLSVRVPWISGLTQALATSLFLRTHGLTGEDRYLAGAKRAAMPLLNPIGKGGTIGSLEGLPWVEEYPSDPPTHVLNGCLFGLIALMELSTFDESFAAQADRVKHSVLNMFHRFEAGKYLRYDLLRKDFCNPHYMGLQALLNYHLFELSGEEGFLGLASRIAQNTDWTLYMRSIHHVYREENIHWIKQHFQ